MYIHEVQGDIRDRKAFVARDFAHRNVHKCLCTWPQFKLCGSAAKYNSMALRARVAAFTSSRYCCNLQTSIVVCPSLLTAEPRIAQPLPAIHCR
jgi:hypothetical protein